MHILNPTDYPLSQSRDIAQVYSWFRVSSVQESELIEEAFNEKHMIHLVRIGHPKFYFKVFNPHLEGNLECYYYLNYNPESENPIPNTSYNQKREELFEHFRIWISLLKQYDAVSFTEDAFILRKYENEYYSSFGVGQTDEADHPLNEGTQIRYYYVLEGIVNGLKNASQDADIVALTMETEALKNNLQNLSQRTFAIKAAKILAKIRKKGVAVLATVWDEVKKQLIKKGIEAGFDGIQSFISNHHLFH